MNAMTGLVSGATLAVIAGVILSAFGGAGVALVVPFAAALFGAMGALAGYLVDRWRRAPRAR